MLSLLVPLGLVFAPAIDSRNEFMQQLPFLTSNWLYMAAPQLLVMISAAFVTRIRQHFAVAALIALTLLLVNFQCWICWFVPGREGSLAWIFYIPLSVVLLLAMALYTWAKRRR